MALAKTRVVFQFPNVGSWLENIAVRSNGLLLCTRVDVPEVWQIDPATGAGSVVATLPAPRTSVTGIAELPESPDVFVIGTGQYEQAKGPVVGSWEVWTLDATSGATELVVATPDVGLLNGITTVAEEGTVLFADSEFGALYSVDVEGKSYAKVLADKDTMASPEGAPMSIGINGLKVRGGSIYFTNSMRQGLYRLPAQLTTSSATPAGEVEAVASGFMCDDFAFAADGSAYITTHGLNTVVKVAEGEKTGETVAGAIDTLELAGGTACAFGRGESDKDLLYVVTAGGLSMPVKGELVEPAKVVAVEVS